MNLATLIIAAILLIPQGPQAPKGCDKQPSDFTPPTVTCPDGTVVIPTCVAECAKWWKKRAAKIANTECADKVAADTWLSGWNDMCLNSYDDCLATGTLTPEQCQTLVDACIEQGFNSWVGMYEIIEDKAAISNNANDKTFKKCAAKCCWKKKVK